jgi:ABC-2 type transport system permease protein
VPPYINAKLKILRNGILPLTRGGVLSLIIFGFLGSLFFILDYLFFYKIFHNLYGIEAIPEKVLLALSSKLMGLVFLTTYTMLIFSAAVSTLSFLYLDNDLELLFSLPLKRPGIRALRVLQAFVNAGIMVFLLVLPVLFSYFNVRSESSLLALMSLACFALFLLAPMAWGASITVILSRFFPAKRLHQFFTVLGISLLTFLILLFRLARPEALMNPKNTVEMEELLASIALPQESALPSTWLARSIVVAGEGDYSRFFIYLGKLGALALISLAVLALLSSRFHSKGYVRSEEKKTVLTDPGKAARSSFLLKLLRLVPIGKDARAVIYRDLLVFFRSPTEWGQIFILGALVVIYIFNIKYLPKEIAPFRVAVTLLNFATLCFVVASVAARFAFTSVGWEGKAFFTSKSLPISPKGYMFAKFLFTAAPLSLFSTATFYFAGRLIELSGMPLLFFLTASIISPLFLTSLAIYMGSKSPLFDERNPAKMLVTINGFVYMFFALIYVAVLVILSAKPVYYHYMYVIAGAGSNDMWFTALSKIMMINLPVLLLLYLAVRNISAMEQK